MRPLNMQLDGTCLVTGPAGYTPSAKVMPSPRRWRRCAFVPSSSCVLTKAPDFGIVGQVLCAFNRACDELVPPGIDAGGYHYFPPPT